MKVANSKNIHTLIPDVYEVMKSKLETMNCFIKYKSYTSSTSVPVIAREVVEQ